MDQVQGVHLLALILMKAFDLNVKDGLRIYIQPLGFLKINGQILLFAVLNGQKAV